MPRIEQHGRIYFRHVRCSDARQDAICEMVALAWKWSLNLMRRGKDPSQFSSAIASYAARAVGSGRRLCRQERAKDVLSPVAQRRRELSISSLPDFVLDGNPLEEALRDNKQTPVPDQVTFRMDFPEWLRGRSQRDQQVIEDLMMGERTLTVARRHGITASRVSQLRRRFMEEWYRYGDPDEMAD